MSGGILYFAGSDSVISAVSSTVTTLQAYKANMKVLQAQDKMLGTALDIPG
jgi:flagellar basal body rod protein FlgC